MRAACLALCLAAGAASAQSLTPKEVADGLHSGSVAQTLAWVCVVEGLVIIALAGALWKAVTARFDDLRASHAATLATLTDVVGLAQKQSDGLRTLDRALHFATRGQP